MRVQKNRASPPQQTGSKQLLPLSFPAPVPPVVGPHRPATATAGQPSVGDSGGLGRQEGSGHSSQHPQGAGGQDWLRFQEEA